MGTLYLMPSALGGENAAAVLPRSTLDVLARIRYFIAENPKGARAFLKAAGFPVPVQEARIETLDEHTPPTQLPRLLEPLVQGFDGAVLSEAGCPAIADPGAALVRLAHVHGVIVRPLVGPSALLLAVMASGMNGQAFAFHGYLPVDRVARSKRLIDLERESERRHVTQLFIEAPYRNDSLFQAVLEACQPDTLICVASDLTLSSESVRTQTVAQWKESRPRLARRPSVFLLYREAARGAGKR